jgi:ParB-like chromosome segregation protein Spo0J
MLTARGQLIAGQRRLEAHRRLKRATILCCVVEDLKDAMVLLQAEITENTCR